jgi:KUP system potassium uptake protein
MSSFKSSNKSVIRSNGSAIYITQHKDKIPTALVDNTKQFKDIPEHLVLLYVESSNSSHVLPSKRFKIDELKLRDGIVKIELTYGYKDNIDIPKALKSLKMKSSELNFDLDKAIYYISKDKVIRSRRNNMSGWRKTIYLLMSKNELSDPDFYKLPVDRTNEFTTLISL